MIEKNNGKQIIALSGGIGGAKLVLGLSKVLPAQELLVVTNTGDDFDHFGLRICPDTDTVLYTLSGLSDPVKGWGRVDETWTFMQAVQDLGGQSWFNLGDGDLALHVLRTERLNSGMSLTEVTAELATAMGIDVPIVPMSDQSVGTVVHTPEGQLAFQHYFVRDRCVPQVTGFEFSGIDSATPNPILLEALDNDPGAIVIAPSNPFVSVDPILELPGLRARLKTSDAPIIAVSPIVGGQAIKGPAAKMMSELGKDVSALGVARHYQGLIDGLVIDEQDRELQTEIEDLGMAVTVAPTIMHDLATRIALAQVTLEFAEQLAAK